MKVTDDTNSECVNMWVRIWDKYTFVRKKLLTDGRDDVVKRYRVRNPVRPVIWVLLSFGHNICTRVYYFPMVVVSNDSFDPWGVTGMVRLRQNFSFMNRTCFSSDLKP